MRRVEARTFVTLNLLLWIITGCGPKAVDMSWLNGGAQGVCPEGSRQAKITSTLNNPWFICGDIANQAGIEPNDAQLAACVDRTAWLDPNTGELVPLPAPLSLGIGCIDLEDI